MSNSSLTETDDLRIAQIRPLIAPAVLMADLPASDTANHLVNDTRTASAQILRGEDDRLLAVVGPCSIHDPEAALEYGERLSKCAARVADDLLVVMRVYFEKPRTTVGWKGLINDPAMDGSFDINDGLRIARKLLIDLAEMGVPAGTEFLDTISPQFVADLVAWGAIGARTTESQVHRELASGLSMPVGFKNGTGGSIQIAMDGIKAAACPHHFLSVTKQGVSAIVETTGNDNCHVILRGSSAGPNFDHESVKTTSDLLEKNGLRRELMVDCSHGNSRKIPENQPAVAADLGQQIAGGSRDVASVMVESHLVAGAQKIDSDRSKLQHGQSVTDACLGWEDTEQLLEGLASSVSKRRKS
jgi:3-deoxy-7-phosphoheptulonate synthase